MSKQERPLNHVETGEQPTVEQMVADCMFEAKENARDAETEKRVASEWDAKFGDPFPDLLARPEQKKTQDGTADNAIDVDAIDVSPPAKRQKKV